MGRLRSWVRRLLRREPPRRSVEAEPPFDEPALVPRRPRSPGGAGSAVLELPEEPEDVDARGPETV